MRKAITAAHKVIAPALAAAKAQTIKSLKAMKKADDDKKEADAVIDEITLGSLDDIGNIKPQLENIYNDAASEILGQVEIDFSGEIVNLVNERAVAYARTRAAELVSQIDDTTRAELRDIIADGLADNLTTSEIADMIQDGYAFSEDRSILIAETEVGLANGQGSLQGMLQAKDAGVRLLKQWIPDPDPCPICEDNADEGPIELDEEFSSGDDAPYAHPHCECVIISVQVTDDGDETETDDEPE